MLDGTDYFDKNFRKLIDLVRANIYWKDMEGRYLGCNQQVLDRFQLKSSEDVVGKNNYEAFPSASKEELSQAILNDEFALKHGLYEGEEVFTINGVTTIYFTKKVAFYNNKGELAGVMGTSLDITHQKKLLELEKKKSEEQEKFVQLAHKVLHDITSPVTALNMMIPTCTELPEKKRIFLNKATERILDIANNLLSHYRKENNDTNARASLLVSDTLIQLLSEKRVQYHNRSVTFDTAITNAAQFAFIYVQPTEFRRAISNVVNNAVDALEQHADGHVTVQLTVDNDVVVITIQDNGKGIPADLIKKMQTRQSFTAGKKQGHGLGLQQVWDTLEHNQGSMEVHSTLGKGTSIQLTFPRAATPAWIAQEIHLSANNIIVILDDDDSIHTAWDLRFAALLASYPALRLHHFKQGKETLYFFAGLNQEEKSRVIFLSDYELLHQDRNGLQIIEDSKIAHTILVTSYYSSSKIQGAINRLGIKVLPKQMASVVPVFVDTDKNNVVVPKKEKFIKFLRAFIP